MNGIWIVEWDRFDTFRIGQPFEFYVFTNEAVKKDGLTEEGERERERRNEKKQRNYE